MVYIKSVEFFLIARKQQSSSKCHGLPAEHLPVEAELILLMFFSLSRKLVLPGSKRIVNEQVHILLINNYS